MNRNIGSGLITGAASIPVSLMSGQGIGQAIINAIGTGVGGAAGSMVPGGGLTSTVGGAAIGNVLANMLGTDRNERLIDNLGNEYLRADIAGQVITDENVLRNLSYAKAYDMLPQTKQSKLAEELTPLYTEQEAQRQMLLDQMPMELSEKDKQEVNMIVERIMQSGMPV